MIDDGSKDNGPCLVSQYALNHKNLVFRSFANAGVPACTFARLQPHGGAVIHDHRDTMDHLDPDAFMITLDFVVKYAEKLIKGFVKDYLLRANANVVDAFNLLSSTWNGEFMNDTAANVEASNEWKLLKALNLVDASGIGGDIIDTKNGKSFIKGSAYGDLVEDYAKLDDNPAKSTASRDYTGGNKYVKEIGFEIESDKISLNDSVTDGWFIKSSSEISSLPDSIKNRLFNLSVATGKNAAADAPNAPAKITKESGNITVTDGNKYIANAMDEPTFFYDNESAVYHTIVYR